MKLKSRLDITADEITEELNAGRMQLHRFHLGDVITQIIDLKNEKILHVVWMSGVRFSEWRNEALTSLRDFGRRHGCTAIEAYCRPGLAEALKPDFRTIKRMVRAEI